ncbi:MAG TPA: ABC transporter permease [Sedimentisphaerales bacterium]|nr:ABC transporter permease [Sedimentisphaerales bacterium]
MRLNILTIYLKEMKEVLRDRKTLIFMVALPTLVVPVLMNIMIGFIVRAEKKARTEILTFAIFGAEHLPDLANAFSKEEGFEKVNIPTQEAIASAIEENKIKFGLVIPQTTREQLERDEQVAVRFYYNNASATSKVKNRAGKVIREFSEKYRSERLAGLGLDTPQEQEHLLNPVTIEEHNTADMREVLGERVGGMLPYLFIIFCFMGALYPAIDLGAGEKERGTLETLLLAPIPRYQIVLGKFFVIFTTGVTAALLCLTSLGFMLAAKGQEITGELGEVIASVSVVDLVLIAAMLIPTAAMFAALLLSVSIYAKSFKEASAYCGPLNFLVIMPAIIAMLPIVKLDWYWAMVPITNISLAIKELIKGTMNYEMLIAILGSSLVIAGAFLFFCTRWFEREAVLFRK